jgi:hypothetical protein
MLAKMLHSQGIQENTQATEERKECSPNGDGMTQRLTSVGKQHDQKERQNGREWDQPSE